jgi:hypothetical protein
MEQASNQTSFIIIIIMFACPEALSEFELT